MPVSVGVPTRAEMHEHYRRWKALPVAERPERPFEVWSHTVQRWISVFITVAGDPTDDDTPQPGYRLVPLPVPVGVGWRKPVDEAEALAAGREGADVMEWTTGGRWIANAVGSWWHSDTHTYRVPASWAEGRERVSIKDTRLRTIDQKAILGTYPANDPPLISLDDIAGTSILATVIDGTAYVWVDPLPEPAPETERVNWWEAKGRLTPKGEEIDGVRHTCTFDAPQYRIIWSYAWLNADDGTVEVLVESAAPSEQSPSAESAGGEAVAECSGEVASAGECSGSPATEEPDAVFPLLPTEDRTTWQVSVTYEGTTDQVGEPQSATPATDSVPTSAAGATTPTRPDPPEGWVVCRDREILREADERRMARWWSGFWSDPLGGWDYDARFIDEGRFAVPVSMVPAEPWTPQVGDRVLVEAVVKHWADGVDPLLAFPDAKSGVTGTRMPADSLRPFPEDGA